MKFLINLLIVRVTPVELSLLEFSLFNVVDDDDDALH